MEKAFIAKGHGYEQGSQGRCTAFDGFDIIAAPLGGFSEADRASRSFSRPGASYGVTYGSHVLKLATRTGTTDGNLYILMHHGGGREVLQVPRFFDAGGMLAAVLAMGEREQYALLYTLYQTANNARYEANSATREAWATAYVDGRIRKRRKGGRVTVSIETEFERDLRTGKASPSRVSIDMASGTLSDASEA